MGAVGGAVQKHSKTVRDSGQDSLQVFPDGLGTAGKVDDQGPSPDARRRP